MGGPQLFPIYGRFVGDFVPHLVSVLTSDTMPELAEKVAVHFGPVGCSPRYRGSAGGGGWSKRRNKGSGLDGPHPTA